MRRVRRHWRRKRVSGAVLVFRGATEEDRVLSFPDIAPEDHRHATARSAGCVAIELIRDSMPDNDYYVGRTDAAVLKEALAPSRFAPSLETSVTVSVSSSLPLVGFVTWEDRPFSRNPIWRSHPHRRGD